MLVNATWPRGVEDWKESKSMAQPAESEDRVEVMCCSGGEGVIKMKVREGMCKEEEARNIYTHLLYSQAAMCPWEPLD